MELYNLIPINSIKNYKKNIINKVIRPSGKEDKKS